MEEREVASHPTPPFGIVSETFDPGGPPAYETRAGQLLAFVQSGMAYDSPANANYVSVVDPSRLSLRVRYQACSYVDCFPPQEVCLQLPLVGRDNIRE